MVHVNVVPVQIKVDFRVRAMLHLESYGTNSNARSITVDVVSDGRLQQNDVRRDSLPKANTELQLCYNLAARGMLVRYTGHPPPGYLPARGKHVKGLARFQMLMHTTRVRTVHSLSLPGTVHVDSPQPALL